MKLSDGDDRWQGTRELHHNRIQAAGAGRHGPLGMQDRGGSCHLAGAITANWWTVPVERGCSRPMRGHLRRKRGAGQARARDKSIQHFIRQYDAGFLAFGK